VLLRVGALVAAVGLADEESIVNKAGAVSKGGEIQQL